MKRVLCAAFLITSLAVVAGCGLTDPDPVTGVSPLALGIGVAAREAQKDMTPAGLIAAGVAGLVATVGALVAVKVVSKKKTP